ARIPRSVNRRCLDLQANAGEISSKQFTFCRKCSKMEIKSGASTGKMRLRGSFMGIFQRLKQRFLRKKQPVRLGIALGSGGAKGMAHLGALKAFEEAGITFSFVAGTSIG